MEDVKIMKNMKEVLKESRKAKHKKPRGHNGTSNGTEPDDAISEILSAKWMFSSPPTASKVITEETSKKVNAFERMMTKKVEPLAQISPEVNGQKKKRKYARKPKYKKLEIDQFDEPRDENNEAKEVKTEDEVKGFENENEMRTEDVDLVEGILPRKRSRVNDMLISNSANKKKKTKLEKMLLDSNENAIVTPVKAMNERNGEEEVATPTYQSGRPKRSCAGNINYEFIISPDKVHKSPEPSQKRNARSKPSKKVDDVEDIYVIDDESPVRPKKLAPLFVKKLPKPAIDPVVKEARRKFLLLGLPEDLRNTIDKQRQFEEEILSNELIAFPSISHITQLRNEEESVIITESSWQKSLVKINASENEGNEENQHRLLKRGLLTDCFVENLVPAVTRGEIRLVEREPIDNVKKLVKELKDEFGDFPTNRCFKQLFKNYQKAIKEHQDSDYLSQGENDENLLFVDIFKPNRFDEFLVNTKPIKELQKFLLTWNNKEKSSDYDSDASCSQRSSTGLNNFIVLTGFHGCGKTSSVYALANDLNYQVIEINAGSRRSGKIMLQELSEATQSHRVKNKSVGKLFDVEADDNSQESKCDVRNGEKTIILIEDAELVFESDDGFVASLQQLINISKRPVILTTNNRNCQHLQKFIQQNEIVFENPTNSHHISRYLSLLCLVANYQINAVNIERLYALNKYDMRRTINEIEFFIRTKSSRTKSDDLMEFYQRPQLLHPQREQLKSLSSICFETSIASSYAAMFIERSNADDASCHQQHLMAEMADFFDERCNVVETQRDFPHGKQKLIER